MSPFDDTDPGHGEFRGTHRFQVVRRIGAGGIGYVYEAIDREDGSRVAVKTLQRLDSDALLRFKSEFRLLQDLHHRNLVRLGELFEHEGTWFFTMELLDGMDFMRFVAPGSPAFELGEDETVDMPTDIPTMTSLMAPCTPSSSDPDTIIEPASEARPGILHTFDEDRLRAALTQLTEGLIVLHRAGRVHRDIKPHNVMVVGGRVVLLDFGLVSEQSGDAHERGMILGTPAYMAPEQAAGRTTTPASDWYGVGVMLYEAMVGRRPFEGSSAQIMLAKQSVDPEPPWLLSPAAPRDLGTLCMDLLCRAPEGRPTGAEILARLTSTDPGLLRTSEPSLPAIGLLNMLIGREPLLADLDAAFAQRGPGQPMVAFVHGGSGMGKTALVDEFVRRARDLKAGALVLRGRCYERETVPYKGFDGVIDALARYLKRPESGAELLVPQRLDTLVRLFPVLQGVRKPLGLPQGGARDPQELRREAFAALKELLARIAGRWPLVVVIDDLQWGDLDSAALLAELLSPPNAPGMLLIASYRSEEADNPLIVSLRDNVTRAVTRRRVRELVVGPLSEDDSRRLARVSLETLSGERGPGLYDGLAAAVARASAGNPFFVAEMVRYLVMTGAHRDGARPSDITLADVMVARRQRLDVAARAVLDVVAVAGRPIAQGVALQAAGRDASERAVLDGLRAENLVRTRGGSARDPVECYHDRIREAMIAELDPDELERANQALAAALEASGVADPETLAECYLGAGDTERAAAYALQAAAHAESALAFERAARMYRMVLELRSGAEDDQARVLRIKLGEALVNAARGAEAAAEFMAASIGAPEDEAMELERRAAEQLLCSGRIDQGLSLLSEVLSGTKLHVPRTDQGALMSLALHRARLRVRGLDYKPRQPEAVPARARARIDMCWAGAVGLGMVDPIRGADFSTRCLIMSLDTGDEALIARTLAMEAGQIAAGGGKATARAEALADRAAALARRIDDPHALGLAIFGSGAAALLSGRWRTALGDCSRAEAVLRERCVGVAWETTTAQTFQLAALYYMGDWSTLNERASVALRHALERGDLYMVTSLVSYATFGRLADDDVDGARQAIRNATVRWSLRGYHVQHYLKLMSHLFADLYEGLGDRAWARMQQEWPMLSSSLLRRVQLLRIEMAHGRARCALARAIDLGTSPGASPPGEREQLLKLAASEARGIERERMRWATPLASLIRAALAVARGQGERAVELLERAATAFSDADMMLFAAAARWRQGEIMGGSLGDEQRQAADGAMRAQGIVNPARIVATLAPGFGRG